MKRGRASMAVVAGVELVQAPSKSTASRVWHEPLRVGECRLHSEFALGCFALDVAVMAVGTQAWFLESARAPSPAENSREEGLLLAPAPTQHTWCVPLVCAAVRGDSQPGSDGRTGGGRMGDVGVCGAAFTAPADFPHERLHLARHCKTRGSSINAIGRSPISKGVAWPWWSLSPEGYRTWSVGSDLSGVRR